MPDIAHLISEYGYGMVAALVMVESLGVPVPGETALIAASAFAATGKLKLWLVIVCAAGGGVIGDNIGFLLGQRFGYWLLVHYGHYIFVTPPRIKAGQYLFLRHGRRVVFFGRFLPVLRELAAFLGGANQMRWVPFLIANTAGAIIWASVYGGGAWLLGKSANGADTVVQIVIGIIATAVFLALSWYLWKHEQELEAEAEKALPGPLRKPAFWRQRLDRH